MAEMLSPLATRLAAELAAEINKVQEPYRTNLIQWINNQAGREISNLNGDLTVWLSELGDAPEMTRQYVLVRGVCQKAETHFSTMIGL